ncbi:MAG: C4-dicarboxylate ABC transporter permease, partial [Alphaproteobacteria bacterium]|nr:C4-dicarboxylate ABC transporter permease [Alphaproteobacteria bacterium]
MSALKQLVRAIDAANEHLGRAVSWFALFLVLMQFAVVLLRYVFGLGFIPMQESVLFMHSILFLVGAGYT